LKRGICTPESTARYRAYIAALRELVEGGKRPWSSSVTIVELPSRHGFGFAVRQGLLSRISEYVMVVQHDRPFARGFDLAGLLDAMDSEAASVKYVCLPTHSTHQHPSLFLGRSKVRLPPERRVGQVSLAPIAFWYDSTHVVRRSFYLEHVFGYGREPSRVRRGQFPEEALGTSMMADIQAHGAERHAHYGTWVLVDALAPAGTPPEKGHFSRTERLSMYGAGVAKLKQVAAAESRLKDEAVAAHAGGASARHARPEQEAAAAAQAGGVSAQDLSLKHAVIADTQRARRIVASYTDAVRIAVMHVCGACGMRDPTKAYLLLPYGELLEPPRRRLAAREGRRKDRRGRLGDFARAHRPTTSATPAAGRAGAADPSARPRAARLAAQPRRGGWSPTTSTSRARRSSAAAWKAIAGRRETGEAARRTRGGRGGGGGERHTPC
jgi:hypothetical protein